MKFVICSASSLPDIKLSGVHEELLYYGHSGFNVEYDEKDEKDYIFLYSIYDVLVLTQLVKEDLLFTTNGEVIIRDYYLDLDDHDQREMW